jgi:hypothetical protein
MVIGSNQGKVDIFIENLLSFPDNITSDGSDTFWLALNQGPPTRQMIDPFLPRPLLSNIMQRLPEALRLAPARYSFVLGPDLEGNVRHNLQDPSGESYAEITSVIEHGGTLYLGSIGEDSIGRIPTP